MSFNAVEKVQATDLKEYKSFFKEIKEKILTSQVKAALAVNHELINLYWEIGSKIHLKQKDEGWGAKTIENLANDLKSTFPEMKGFSHRNLKYMVHFAKEYPDLAIGQQVVAQIPWSHNILLLQKLETLQDRLWYAHKTIEHGWSRNVLLHWLGSDLHKREGKAITNFQNTLPSPQSDLAHQTLKDPYCFDFLTLRDKHDEQELESGLLDHVQKFLLITLVKKAKGCEPYSAAEEIVSKSVRNPTIRAEDVEKRGKGFYENTTETAHIIFRELVDCIEKGLTPNAIKVQRIIKKHHEFTNQIQDATQEVYKAMAELYQKHPEFRKQLDSFHPKLPEFMSEGMIIFADKELN